MASLSTISKTLSLDYPKAGSSLAASITWNASKQTYYTVRFFVDRDLVQDAYRAYAYFRWVDDRLDNDGLEAAERGAFIENAREGSSSAATAASRRAGCPPKNACWPT